MAFDNLFVRTKRSIGGIQLDATLSESHDSPVKISKNPVELGANITDHAIIEPKVLTIVAEVSDTPLGLAAFGQIVDLVTGLFGSSTSENLTRSNAAYNAMIQLQEALEPIEVQTKLKLYKDMLIANISTLQDKDTSNIVAMVIRLEEILIVESEVVKLKPAELKEGSPKDQASPAENSGRKEAITPSDTTNKSVLKFVVG